MYRFSRCSLIFPGFPGRVGTLAIIFPLKETFEIPAKRMTFVSRKKACASAGTKIVAVAVNTNFCSWSLKLIHIKWNLPFTSKYNFNISRKRHKYHSSVLLSWRWLFSTKGFLCEVVSPITHHYPPSPLLLSLTPNRHLDLNHSSSSDK